MNHDHAHRHLSASDPRLAALIARSRRYEIKPALSIRPFDALAESIAYQQLSGKAAATIFGRVRALYPKRKWLDPEKLLATPDEKLRAAGLSRAKTAALKDLAAKTIDCTVPSGRALIRMSDDEIIARLTTVRGIGRWTVEMLLLFDLGRPDLAHRHIEAFAVASQHSARQRHRGVTFSGPFRAGKDQAGRQRAAHRGACGQIEELAVPREVAKGHGWAGRNAIT